MLQSCYLHYDLEQLEAWRPKLMSVNGRKSVDIGDSLHLACTAICQYMADGIGDDMVVAER